MSAADPRPAVRSKVPAAACSQAIDWHDRTLRAQLTHEDGPAVAEPDEAGEPSGCGRCSCQAPAPVRVVVRPR